MLNKPHPRSSPEMLAIRRRSEIERSAQQLPAEEHGGGQASDVLVIRGEDVGLDGVLALYLLSARVPHPNNGSVSLP
jgi:hypothetical protein